MFSDIERALVRKNESSKG